MRNAIVAALFGAVLIFGCSRNPLRDAPEAGLPLTNAAPINLKAAIARAKAEHKLVFLNFTGSDWCPSCKQLQKEVFSQRSFQDYAASNLVFIDVDFPMKFRFPPATSVTNNLLAEKFNVQGTPTLIALNGSGREIWKHLGPIDGGPAKLFAELNAAKKKQP